MNVNARLKDLLNERVRPLVADRGGDLTIQEFCNGVLRLSISGSPGAAVPIKDNIAKLIRHYIPEVAAVELVAGTAGAGRNADVAPGSSPLSVVQHVLNEQINPAVSAHGGFIRLIEVRNGEAFVRMEGGCQGCAMAHVTLCQGVAVMIKEQVPEIIAVVDLTDHESGANPYFKTKKS